MADQGVEGGKGKEQQMTFGEAIALYGFKEAAKMLGETFKRKPGQKQP